MLSAVSELEETGLLARDASKSMVTDWLRLTVAAM